MLGKLPITRPDYLPIIDGRGRYLDNNSIERLWQSLKQEPDYLHEIINGFQAKPTIKTVIGFYNAERPHTALDKRRPDTAHIAPSGDTKSGMTNAMHLSQAEKVAKNFRTTSVGHIQSIGKLGLELPFIAIWSKGYGIGNDDTILVQYWRHANIADELPMRNSRKRR
ncbi:MAG: integrase core domain-containing protein [Yoonia sp.]|nr:integrase core domain-containing protein [Yoonia sp.]